jgi:hypothetical protein
MFQDCLLHTLHREYCIHFENNENIPGNMPPSLVCQLTYFYIIVVIPSNNAQPWLPCNYLVKLYII